MILRNLLDYVDDIKPNAYSPETKTAWVNEIEGMVQTEVMLLAIEDVVTYTYAEHANTELLAKPPHDKIYGAYLCAMIDFANGEYNKYNNTMQMFNSYYGEFMRWYAQRYRPADEVAVFKGYYLSAYSLALKHGFVGTEDEWLASLNGADGKDGDNGKDGVDGKNGTDGKDGVSPVITVTPITGGNRVTITDANGTKSFDIKDGTDGKNGSNGNDGTNGKDGTDGKDGRGITDIRRTSGNGAAGTTDTYTIYYTDNTTSTFTVYNGANGTGGGGSGSGEDGATFTPYVDANGNLSWTNDKGLPNPATVNIKGANGKDGSNGTNGKDGADGKTPVKGTDYFTEADKTELVNDVLSALTTWEGGSY